MTGIDSYSPTANTNDTTNGGNMTWAEQQFPSTVNNSARLLLANIRAQFNDLPWFQYGNGDQDTATHLAKPCVYASATSFTVVGNDVTAAYSAGRPVRAVGTLTGTIYGTISSSSYLAGTNTVNVSWISGSLQSETLVISIGLPTFPAGGMPAPIYDMFIYISGVLGDGEVYPRAIQVRNVRLPASLTGSQFKIGISPTATLALTIKKNTTSIGTISFNTGGTPTVTFASAIDFAAGDTLSLTGPSPADATGANISATFIFQVLP